MGLCIFWISTRQLGLLTSSVVRAFCCASIPPFSPCIPLILSFSLCDPSPATVVAVNDPFLTPEYAAYQFKHDSVHGMIAEEVTFGDGCLMIGGKTVKFFSERNPAGEFPFVVGCGLDVCV